mgnify:CR=1 FL=1
MPETIKGFIGPMPEKIKDLLALARGIWGPDRLTLQEIVVRAQVTLGDLARVARGATKDLGETNAAREREIKKEIGNLIFSSIRWCDDLGLDPQECVNLAIEAQRKFVAENRTR